jgi:hypothetical protein
MRVQCRSFRSYTKSWDDLCAEASTFASTIERTRLINISVSADGGQGVICVWYWE